MMVRFAIVCDICKKRQEEYQGSFALCKECGADICESCFMENKIKPCCEDYDWKLNEP